MRITPACAGKVHSTDTPRPSREDHPRVCGESAICAVVISFHFGSPPRVRGKLLSYPGNNATLGITPACAGKVTFAICELGIRKDHPRVCGESIIYTYIRVGKIGSPPRVRGKCDRGYK